MTWTPEPATAAQLRYLRHLGCTSEEPISRAQAAEKIRQYQDQQAAELNPTASAAASKPSNCRGDAPPKTHFERREFWLDTCREIAQMHARCPQVIELYRQHGCRFLEPSPHEVQAVLDALDAAMLHWEKAHPELFYQALELNYPELVRRQ